MRFINADPIGFAGGMNWYTFVGNNPMGFVDPWGLCKDSSGGGWYARRGRDGIYEVGHEGFERAVAQGWQSVLAWEKIVNPLGVQLRSDLGGIIQNQRIIDPEQAAMLPMIGWEVRMLSRTMAAEGNIARTVITAENATARSVADKLQRYLLNPDHPIGRAKAKWFEKDLGYTRANAGDLAKQLVFDEAKAVQTGVTQYGTKFNQVINIVGANGRTIPVKTAWIRGSDGVARLVTVVPGD
jgi:hypothetical protein